MNKLDLAKVGKAFGFTVPPRVNITVGGGTGGGGKSGKKRKRDEDGGEEETEGIRQRPFNSINKRKEVLGKKVEKEVYRKQKLKDGGDVQWTL